MLCPAVGLEHSKKVRELLYRRVLRAWRHNTNKLDEVAIISQYNKLQIRNVVIQYGKIECMVNYYGQASLVFPEAYASEDLYHCLAIPMSGAYAVRSIINSGANNALALLMDNNGAYPDYQSMIWMQYIVIGMQTV